MKVSKSKEQIRFFLVSAVVGLSLLGDALLYAVLPARPEEFRILIWQVGILLGANRLVRLITNELAGRMADRFRSERLLLAAVIVGSLVTASYALPWGFYGLLLARITWGACWSVLRVEGYLAALTLSTDRNRGKIFAAYEAIARTGSGGGVLLGGFLCDLIGIKPTFLIFGIVTASGILLVLRMHPSCGPDAGEELSSEIRPGQEVDHVQDAGRRLKEKGNRDVSTGESQIFLWGCALAITMTDQMLTNLTGRIVVDKIAPGLPYSIGITSLTGLLLSFRSLGTLVIGPLAGILSDRIGRKKLLLIVTVLQALTVSLLVFSRHWLLTILLLVMLFMIAISARLGIDSMAGDRAPPEGRALFMSRFSTFADLGTALGPIIGFSIYAGFGFPWVAVLALVLIGLVFGSLFTATFKNMHARMTGQPPN